MEAVFEGGAGFDEEAAEAGEEAEALDMEGRLIGGPGFKAEKVEGDGMGVDAVGFGAGEEGFGEVTDGIGVKFVDLDGAAAFSLEGAEEPQVVIAGGFKATDDGGIGAAETGGSDKRGGQGGPAFGVVGEGDRGTEGLSFRIEKGHYQFFEAYVPPVEYEERYYEGLREGGLSDSQKEVSGKSGAIQAWGKVPSVG